VKPQPHPKPTVRRRGIAILALSLVFLILGLQRDHTVYLLVAAVFLLSGLASVKPGWWGDRT
jgi:hypothetical protein